jgi:hypothetical protein
MSSIENKVEVITEFLENRAQLQRVTGFQEIGEVAGKKLLEKGYRNYSSEPVSRSDVASALAVIADQSFKDNQVILPAVVTKFWTNEPTHEFAQWAGSAGLMEGELESCGEGPVRDTINELAPVERAKVFSHYATWEAAKAEVEEFLKAEAEKQL